MKFDKSLHIHAYFLNNQLISIKSKYPSSSFLLIAVKYVFNVYKSGYCGKSSLLKHVCPFGYGFFLLYYDGYMRNLL